MKKILSLLLVCIMLVLTGCEYKQNNSEPTPKKDIAYSIPVIYADDVEVEEAEYSRNGTEPGYYITWDERKFFEYPATEVTAKVKITKYCGDLQVNGVTYDNALFKAKILACYKGDYKAGDDIYIDLYFSGHSTESYGFPLFGIGDVMLLNLAHYTELGLKREDDIYYVVGGKVGLVDVVKYNGVEYAINRATDSYLDEFDAKPVDDDLRQNILEAYYEQDPVRKGIGPIWKFYVYSDLEKTLVKRYFETGLI